MKKHRKIFSLAVVALALLLCGCLSSPHQGLLFSMTGQHVYGSGAGTLIGAGRIKKKGMSCSWGSYPFTTLFFYGTGGNIQEAMRSAGITRAAVIDRSSMNVLLLFHRECVIVWGE